MERFVTQAAEGASAPLLPCVSALVYGPGQKGKASFFDIKLWHLELHVVVFMKKKLKKDIEGFLEFSPQTAAIK